MLARTTGAVTLVSALLIVALPGASAATTLSLFDLADVATPLKEKGTASVPFKVNLVTDGFGCPQPSSFPVLLNVTGTIPPGTTVKVEPPQVDLAVPQGIYTAPPVPGTPLPVNVYNGSADAVLSFSVTNVTANATLSLNVVATFAGGPPAGCQAQSAPGAAEATGKVGYVLVAPPPPPAPEPEAEEKSFLPVPGAGLVVVAALAVALLARRR